MCDTTPSGTIVNLCTQELQFESSGTLRADERRLADGDADRRLAIFHVETADDVHADHSEKPLADGAGLPARRDPPLSPRRPAGHAGRSRSTTPRPGRDRAPDRLHRAEFDEPRLLAVRSAAAPSQTRTTTDGQDCS